MLSDLLTVLSHGLEAPVGWALFGAFAWGVASMVLSPCHLTAIPLLVAYINGGPTQSSTRAGRLALAFGLGVLVAIGVVGVLAVSLGRLAGDVGPWATYAVVVVLTAAGLSLLDVMPISWNVPDVTRWRGRGTAGAVGLGLLFGIALGPCTFAYLAPVLAAAFTTGQHSTGVGLLLVAAFAIGHCLLIVVAGTAAGRLYRWLAHHQDGHRRLMHLRHASGVLVLAGALYLAYVA